MHASSSTTLQYGNGLLSIGWKKETKTKQELVDDDKLTAAGLAAEIGVTAKAIEKHLAKLKAEGIIEREGPDKGGSWKVN